MKCFFHRSDLDGICSGAIVQKRYPSCTMIGFDYEDEFLFERLNPKELIILVDISLSSENMIRLFKSDIKVIWIDHHHSTLLDAEKAGYTKIRGFRRTGVGACELTWRYFFETPIPRSVQLLSQYDVWNHKDPEVVPFYCGLSSLSLSVYSNLWAKLFEESNIEYTIRTGQKILLYIKNAAKKTFTLLMYKQSWYDLSAVFVNTCIFDSMFYMFLPESNLLKSDIIVSYYRRNDKKYKVSIRAHKSSVDVSKIAKAYGGGGHKSAAGFICDKLPF